MELKILESPIADSECRKQIMSFIHGEPWLPFFTRELSVNDASYKHWHIVMEENGKFIAHCHICQSLKYKDFAQFTYLETHKDFRGRGFGKTVYRKAMEIMDNNKAKIVFLSTSFQHPARKYIYLKDGFTDIFISTEGSVTMAKGFKQPAGKYISEYFVSSEKRRKNILEYADYLATDLVLNVKLNQLPDKNNLPLNAYGRKGGYCMFRDASCLAGKIKIYTSENKIIDFEII